jgi:hypothetical protein
MMTMTRFRKKMVGGNNEMKPGDDGSNKFKCDISFLLLVIKKTLFFAG